MIDKKLTRAEEEVMQLIWSQPEPCTVSSLIEQMDIDPKPPHSTVSKFYLYQKQILRMYKVKPTRTHTIIVNITKIVRHTLLFIHSQNNETTTTTTTNIYKTTILKIKHGE